MPGAIACCVQQQDSGYVLMLLAACGGTNIVWLADGAARWDSQGPARRQQNHNGAGAPVQQHVPAGQGHCAATNHDWHSPPAGLPPASESQRCQREVAAFVDIVQQVGDACTLPPPPCLSCFGFYRKFPSGAHHVKMKVARFVMFSLRLSQACQTDRAAL